MFRWVGVFALSISPLVANSGWSAETVPTAPSSPIESAASKQAPVKTAPTTPAVVHSTAPAAPVWQGSAPADNFQVGFLLGPALIEPSYGLGIVGTAAKRIIKDGWLADVSDAVYLEGAMGPVFVKSQHPLVYSIHLRWEFQFNEQWSLYALGGVGGEVSGPELGNRSLLFLRTGLGAFYGLQDNMKLRLEVSHEWIGVGLAFGF